MAVNNDPGRFISCTSPISSAQQLYVACGHLWMVPDNHTFPSLQKVLSDTSLTRLPFFFGQAPNTIIGGVEQLFWYNWPTLKFVIECL